MKKPSIFDWIVGGKTLGLEVKHHLCKSVKINAYDEPDEWDCGYNTTIDCEDCRYGGRGGRKNPEARCNQMLNSHGLVVDKSHAKETLILRGREFPDRYYEL